MTDRESLAREIRNALGEYNDDDKPVVTLVRELAEQLTVLRTLAAMSVPVFYMDPGPFARTDDVLERNGGT